MSRKCKFMRWPNSALIPKTFIAKMIIPFILTKEPAEQVFLLSRFLINIKTIYKHCGYSLEVFQLIC